MPSSKLDTNYKLIHSTKNVSLLRGQKVDSQVLPLAPMLPLSNPSGQFAKLVLGKARQPDLEAANM